jgi:hypothetical protein
MSLPKRSPKCRINESEYPVFEKGVKLHPFLPIQNALKEVFITLNKAPL